MATPSENSQNREKPLFLQWEDKDRANPILKAKHDMVFRYLVSDINRAADIAHALAPVPSGEKAKQLIFKRLNSEKDAARSNLLNTWSHVKVARLEIEKSKCKLLKAETELEMTKGIDRYQTLPYGWLDGSFTIQRSYSVTLIQTHGIVQKWMTCEEARNLYWTASQLACEAVAAGFRDTIDPLLFSKEKIHVSEGPSETSGACKKRKSEHTAQTVDQDACWEYITLKKHPHVADAIVEVPVTCKLKDEILHTFTVEIPATIWIETKITKAAIGDIIRQMKVYCFGQNSKHIEPYAPSGSKLPAGVDCFALVSTFDLAAEELKSLEESGFSWIKIDQAFDTWFASISKVAAKPHFSC